MAVSYLLALALVLQASPRAVLQDFLWEPTKKIGTVKQIEMIARQDPTTSQLTQIGNNQSPIPNGLLTLNYPGLLIKLRISTYEGGSGLSGRIRSTSRTRDGARTSAPIAQRDVSRADASA